jgi:hypothetical protein
MKNEIVENRLRLAERETHVLKVRVFKEMPLVPGTC